jgi:hypothetical protein
MPAQSKKQQRWAYAMLNKMEKGQKTDTGMTESQVKDFTKLKKGKP